MTLPQMNLPTPLILQTALIVVLLLLLCFFSAAETALTGVSRPLMHELEAQGNRRAGLVNRLQARRERLLGAILIGNTISQILASALATSLAITLFGGAGVAYCTLVLTVIVLLFCEIMPKTLALHNANRVALFLAPPMRAVEWVLGPIAQRLQSAMAVVMRLRAKSEGVGSDPEEEAMAELRGAISIHASEKSATDERKMLHSILDLAEVTVDEIMVHRRNLTTLNGGLPTMQILDLVIASHYSRLPLWKDEPDNIVGVLHAKDLLRALREHPEAPESIDVLALAATPWFIPESISLLDQLRAFRARREHFALVVDEYGALQGVVTLEDVIEEIVGDIADEHDLTVVDIRPQPDGSFIVNGDVTLRDLNRDFDWNLPDEYAATVAGLLLYEARTIPEVGQQFLFHGFRFEVLRRTRNQIASVRVTPPSVGDDTVT